MRDDELTPEEATSVLRRRLGVTIHEAAGMLRSLIEAVRVWGPEARIPLGDGDFLYVSSHTPGAFLIQETP